MKESKRYRFYRKVMGLLAVVMLFDAVAPARLLALTSGPSQPEFSSFEPVATTNLVNDFSGDFTYNIPVVDIPGANGGGYALSLSYHSGASPEEEASWVGYGWTLNPGAINRSRRGFPDDYNGKTVNYWNIAPSNKTASVGGNVSVEGFSTDIPLNLSASLRYNNYKGFGYTAGVGVRSSNGLVSLGYSVSDGEGSFSVSVNPAALLQKRDKEHQEVPYHNKERKSMNADEKKADDKARRDYTAAQRKNHFDHPMSGAGVLSLIGSNYGIFSYKSVAQPATVTGYEGASYNFTASVLAALTPLQVGPTYDITGSYTWQRNVNASGVPNAVNALPAYGYMYSDKAATNGNSMMDYYMEKQNSYDRQDKYLGIPFSNADMYGLSGEGLGGGFRMYNKKAGHFRPNSVSSRMNIYNVGAEVEAGLNIGGGADLGVGFQSLAVNNWDNSLVSGNEFADSANYDEPYFFRFDNDLGGSVEYGTDDSPVQATLTGGGLPGTKSFTPTLPSTDYTTVMNNGDRAGRSSYIAFHTNQQMQYTANGKRYKSYSMHNDVNSLVTRTTNDVKEQVGEFTVFNESGMRYVYGLPTYSRNEGSLSYDLQGVSAGQVDSNNIAYRDITTDIKTKVGEERTVPYATSYLLTDITSPDYVDRTWDGPTDDDFGGWTRFSYRRAYGTNDKASTSSPWYAWRSPYTGLQYERGDLSTQLDDMGAVNYGEKEVYYLDSIITKTHYAVFYTSTRHDGYDAASNSSAANSRTARGTHTLQRLDKIEIYSKGNGTPKLLKTVHFEYDYSLCVGTPNTATPASDGKLTLKKVWVDYEGTVNAKISPYVFEYSYPTTSYPSKYNALDSAGVRPYTLAQNPKYSAFNLDPWGNYQYKGYLRYDSLRNWVDQNPSTAFDPAAWQLKVIKLPTGGEIHVQYEQDDYAYVQDKPVLAMVGLKKITGAGGDGNYLSKYYLRVSDIGISDASSSDPDLVNLKKRIQDEFVTPRKKIYFKFLYKLLASLSTLDLSSCNADYIKGYCNVRKVDIDADGLFIQLGHPDILDNKHDLPRRVCWDYVKKERAGNVSAWGNCDPSTSGVMSSNDAEQIVMNLVGFLATNLIPGNNEMCTEVKPSLSYFRVPMPYAKKGGGIRVKRILMYDSGIESGDASLYGSEYSYKLEDGRTSSGVATNEPVREENALVQFDEKFKQSFLNKVIAGRDKEQVETPIGESILPPPSVGYSRVTIKNIHSGKTNTGFVVKEFYTAKDYPVQVDYTPIETERDFLPLPLGLISSFTSNLWLSQGFTFKLNAMHGQPRSETTYMGDPSDLATAVISSRNEYDYYQPGEEVPVMGSLNSITWKNLGKESEMVMESRGVEDISKDLNLEFDLDVGLAIIPIPFFSVMPSYTYTESKMYQHTTSKVIQYPAIVKSTTSYADGIYHLTENVAFDPHTGQPLLKRTYDGYQKLNLQLSSNHSGRYYNYNFPGATYYDNLGQKAYNETSVLKSTANVWINKKLAGSRYYLEFTAASGYSVCDVMGKLFAGDLVKLTHGSTFDGIYHVDSVDVNNTNNLYLLETSSGTGFGVNTNVTSITGAGAVNVEVLRSGRTNQLTTSVGSITTYGDSANVTNSDPSEQSDRQLLASRIDSLMWISGCSLCTLSTALIPSGLYYIGRSGQCARMQDSVSCIVLDKDAVHNLLKFEVHYPGVIPFCVNAYTMGGHFGIDAVTGELEYFPPGNMCHGTAIDCIHFCPNVINTTQVISASASTMDDHWPYDASVYVPATGSNKYENGERGKWRKQSDYVYRDSIMGANAANQRTYKNAGVFNLQVFDWKNTAAVDSNYWIKLSTVTSYSPDGNALEERDIMGIYSAAKFGYDGTQPYLIAKNSDYQAVQFDGFERIYSSTKFEDGWTPITTFVRDATTGHSGSASLKLTAGGSSNKIDLKPLTVNSHLRSYGASLKVWVKDSTATPGTPLIGRLKGPAAGDTLNLSFTKIARTGEWTLYEAKASAARITAKFSAGTTITPYIDNNYTTGKSLWIDDVRFQPLDASVMTYVYDVNTLRLVATFDDQHFGMFYQYNAEGKLVRKLVETERGMKTITETQYHTPKQQR